MSRPNAEETFKVLSRFANDFNSDDEAFVKEFLKEHRTLQQSIGRLFFKCLEASAELNDSQIDARNASLRDNARQCIKGFEEKRGFKPSQGLPTI